MPVRLTAAPLLSVIAPVPAAPESAVTVMLPPVLVSAASATLRTAESDTVPAELSVIAVPLVCVMSRPAVAVIPPPAVLTVPAVCSRS